MQVNIATRHGELSEQTKEKIISKVEKLLRFFERIISIDVTVDLEKATEPNMELIVRAEHKHDFIGSHQSNDMFGSLDKAIAKVEQQIKKYKEKIQDHGKNVHGKVV